MGTLTPLMALTGEFTFTDVPMPAPAKLSASMSVAVGLVLLAVNAVAWNSSCAAAKEGEMEGGKACHRGRQHDA